MPPRHSGEARPDANDFADHVGGALLAFRSGGHSCSLMPGGKLRQAAGQFRRIDRG